MHKRILFAIILMALVAVLASGCKKKYKASKYFTNPKVAALAEAIQKNDLTKAAAALNEGADINTIGNEDINLLSWAILHKNREGFVWLLDHGADPNITPRGNEGPLIVVAGANEPYWLEQMLAHKADPNLKHPYLDPLCYSDTPMRSAVSQLRKINVEMLIKAGSDVNGDTYIISAANRGWFEGVYILLEAGADCKTQVPAGDLAYFVIDRPPNPDQEVWKEKVVQYLRDHGVDVDAAEKRVQEQNLQDRKERPWLYKDK